MGRALPLKKSDTNFTIQGGRHCTRGSAAGGKKLAEERA
jgi:hypothetical protein